MLDYISKLPMGVIRKCIIDDNRVAIPTEIDRDEFYRKHVAAIESSTLTDEKAVHIALGVKDSKLKTIPELINRR